MTTDIESLAAVGSLAAGHEEVMRNSNRVSWLAEGPCLGAQR